MQIVVLAAAEQKAQLTNGVAQEVVWIKEEKEFLHYPSADVFIDLAYINTPERNAVLTRLLPRLVVINAVADTLQETNAAFVRVNGWTTFLSSPVLEAACNNSDSKAKAEEVFVFFNKQLVWLSDDYGFVTARVVSMIINEAYLALAEKVSTKEEIDTAMKLGTAYPYGPFEWADKIGKENIAALLAKLGQSQACYQPAELLVQEISQAI